MKDAEGDGRQEGRRFDDGTEDIIRSTLPHILHTDGHTNTKWT